MIKKKTIGVSTDFDIDISENQSEEITLQSEVDLVDLKEPFVCSNGNLHSNNNELKKKTIPRTGISLATKKHQFAAFNKDLLLRSPADDLKNRFINRKDLSMNSELFSPFRCSFVKLNDKVGLTSKPKYKFSIREPASYRIGIDRTLRKRINNIVASSDWSRHKVRLPLIKQVHHKRHLSQKAKSSIFN